MSDQIHTVNRRFAADILNVSLRTLDRYVKKNAITASRRGRELYFGEQELLDFKAKLLAQAEFERMQANKFRKEHPAKTEFADVAQAQVMEQSPHFEEQSTAPEQLQTTPKRAKGGQDLEEGLYKNLYEKTDQELHVTREKLQVANYHIGKLEAQVKSMVPQIEYKKQHQELLTLAQESRHKAEDIAELEKQLKIEQVVKKIYAVFLFFMMALLPMLVILRLVA